MNEIDTPNKYIHNLSLSWLGTGTINIVRHISNFIRTNCNRQPKPMFHLAVLVLVLYRRINIEICDISCQVFNYS
jgi:hypothetical protein